MRVTRATAKRAVTTTNTTTTITKRIRRASTENETSAKPITVKQEFHNTRLNPTIKTEEISIKNEPITVKQEFENVSVIKQEITDQFEAKQEINDTIPIKQEPMVKDESTVKQEPTVKKDFTTSSTSLPLFYLMKTTETCSPKLIDQYNKIVSVRNQIVAPVDTMGCERIPYTVDPTLDPKTFRFQLLVLLMLSSQTKDEVTHAAVATMHQHFPRGLCLESILEALEAEIDTLIGKVGFHRRKANYLKRSAEILRSEYNGDIPKLIEEIVKLPGVGPKMGYLLLQAGWDISSGIGVDVHLHRIANLLGWVSLKTPETTRQQLEQVIPEAYWKQINPLVVGFGQTVCLPVAANCDICPLLSACRGVNRKLVKQPRTEARKVKLLSLRGDISRLIDW